jgi:hypothetical protein
VKPPEWLSLLARQVSEDRCQDTLRSRNLETGKEGLGPEWARGVISARPKGPLLLHPSSLKIITHRCDGAAASRNHRLVETQFSPLYRHGVWFAKGGLAEVDACPCGNTEDLVGSGWACCRPLSRQCLVISIAEA